jgi:hypothetical protein
VVQIGEKAYIASALPLTGVAEEVGKVVILTPYPAEANALLFGALLALCFIFSETIIHTYISRTPKTKSHIFILITLTIFIFIVAVAFMIFLPNRKAPRNARLFTIYNSTIALRPGANLIEEGVEQRIAIEVATGGEAINAGRADITYDPTRVEVLEIATDRSFCDKQFVLEKSIDPTAGLATISCGVRTPGFTGTGLLAELIVKPLLPGTFSLTFGKETSILANDGLGTNVLRVMTDGSYVVLPANFSASSDSMPALYSLTHPNTTRWYQKKLIRFAWSPTPDHIFEYALNKERDYTFSGKEKIIAANAIALETPGDGVYYFHLRRRDEGPVASYAVKIDTTPPTDVVIKASDTHPLRGDVVRFEFEATDTMSGLQGDYYVSLDGGLFLPVQQTLSMPFLDAGMHTLTVRVFDKANNFAEATTSILVR